MVIHEGDHGVLHAHLLRAHTVVHVLLELGGQGLDDELGVSDLLSVELDERQQAALRAELVVVVDILEKRTIL
jgi:hypothetical protein